MREQRYRDNKFKGGVTSPKSHGVNKKDTKKWCKGVIGREHIKVWMLHTKHRFITDCYDLVCEVCGKEFDHCYVPRWKCKPRPCKCGHHKKSIDDTPNL